MIKGDSILTISTVDRLGNGRGKSGNGQDSLCEDGKLHLDGIG